jgi:hypothetical protein
MRNIRLLLLLFLMPVLANAQTVIENHETAPTSNWQYFGNCDLEVGFPVDITIPNPGPDAVNGSDSVGQFIRRECAATFAGYFSPGLTVDLTSDNRINLKVWAPNTSTVTLKLEASTDGGPVWEQTIAITDTLQWLNLQFDPTQISDVGPFLAASGFTYSQPVLFFNLGAPVLVSDQVFYWDDFSTENVVTLAKIDLPVTFDDPTVDYTLIDFGGNATTLVADPTDPSNTVASSLRPSTADFFAGTTIGNPDLANAIPFDNDNTRMSVRVYSPAVGEPVRLKVENAGDPTQSCEVELTTTTALAWETLIFDFAPGNEVPGTAALNLAFIFNKANIFFDFNSADGADQTYLWDDVEFIGGGGTGLTLIDLPITFDDTTVVYSFADFGGSVTTLASDPVDPANTVASLFRASTADFFAGTTVSGFTGLANAIPLDTNNSIMTVRFFSPGTGITVKLKVEDNADPTKSVETDAVTTVANAWETLVFDFNNESPGTAVLNPAFTFNKLSIFPNFGAAAGTTTDATYLFDDIYLGFPPVGCSTATPPTNQSSTVLSNRVELNWDPQPGAVACQVKGQRLPSGPSPSVNLLSGDITTTNVPFAIAGTGTTWTWQVRCACSVTPLDVTAFSAFGDTFSIPLARQADMVPAMELFPNPASDYINVSMTSGSDREVVVTMTDMLGRNVMQRVEAIAAGATQLRIALPDAPAGMYLLKVGEAEAQPFELR